MMLDLEKYQLRYKYNDRECGVVFTDIDKNTGYKAAVSIYHENDTLELISCHT